MNRVLLAVAATSLAFALNGCVKKEDTQASAAPAASAAKPAANTPAAQAYEASLAAAKAEQSKASKVGGEWRDTGDIIKQAEEAAAAGDYGKAKSLADKAAAQGRLGQEQAAAEVNMGNPSYLYR